MKTFMFTLILFFAVGSQAETEISSSSSRCQNEYNDSFDVGTPVSLSCQLANTQQNQEPKLILVGSRSKKSCQRRKVVCGRCNYIPGYAWRECKTVNTCRGVVVNWWEEPC